MLFLTSWIAKLTGSAVKAGVDAASSAAEIPKNIAEAQKAILEVKELKRAEEERESPIQKATFKDVIEYDPKYGQIRRKIEVPAAVPYPELWCSFLAALILLGLVHPSWLPLPHWLQDHPPHWLQQVQQRMVQWVVKLLHIRH